MKNLFVCFIALFIITAVGVAVVHAQDKDAASSIEIVDAKLGTGVQDRAITGEAESFPKDSQVFVWFKITGAASQEITVTWKSGDYSYSTTLSIGGSPWRTWAQKNVRQAGDWTVSLVSSDGKALKELSFKVE